MGQDNLFANSFFYSKVKLYILFQHEEVRGTVERRPSGNIKSKWQKNEKFCEENISELFSLNTQAGNKNSHILWEKVKGSKMVCLCWVDEVKDWADLILFSKNKWTRKQNKAIVGGGQRKHVHMPMLASAPCAFLPKCGSISKTMWKAQQFPKSESPAMSKLLFPEQDILAHTNFKWEIEKTNVWPLILPSHYGEKQDFDVFFKHYFSQIALLLKTKNKKLAGLIPSPHTTDSC